MLPLLTLRPDLTRSVLRLSLQQMPRGAHVLDAGHPALLPDSLIGSGVPRSGRKGAPEPDDFEMYLLLTASEYVLHTKDVAFLSHRVRTFNSSGTATVLELLLRAMNFTLDTVHVGPHGLLRLLSSDWDDGFKPPADARNISESVLSSALAAYALPRWASVLRLAGEHGSADRADAFAEGLRRAITSTAWDPMGWVRRAWLGSRAGWVGASGGPDGGVFSAPAGWALVARVLSGAQQDAQLHSLFQHCRLEWRRLGFPYRCRAEPLPAGSGAWPAQNHPMVMGLAEVGQVDAAWDEWTRNSLHRQAGESPSQWLGVWTSSDTMDRGGLPGNWTWAFPALCTHRHAWPLVSFARLAGIVPDAHGLRVRPALPPPLGAYSYSSHLAAARWDGMYVWSGFYKPVVAARWQVEFDFSLVLPAGTNLTVVLTAATDAEPAEPAEGYDGRSQRLDNQRSTAPFALRAPVATRKIEWKVTAVPAV